MTASPSPAKRYQTRQKELVLTCMREQAASWVTAKQVSELLAARGVSVGTATIYRNLERLEAEGLLAKSIVEGTGGTCYRYLDEEPVREESCFYLKCEACGRLMPIDCAELARFYEHFSRDHHIRIDPVKTVLYGTCPDCFEGHDAASEGGRARDGEVAPGAHACSCPHCHPLPHP